MKALKAKGEAGFTILEVMLTMSILLSLTIASTNMMRSSIDMRSELSQQTQVTHRLSVAMQTIVNDLEHAYLIPKSKLEYNYIDRSQKTIFRVKRDADSNELNFTTMSQEPIVANSHASDETYVVYKVDDDPDAPGRSNLYRGSTKVIPDNFREEVPVRILARGIKSLKIETWDGDRFVQDVWDTDRSDWKDMLPPMVKITIVAWDEEPEAAVDRDATREEFTTKLETIVYLPRSFGLAEKKQRSQTIRYY